MLNEISPTVSLTCGNLKEKKGIIEQSRNCCLQLAVGEMRTGW